MPSRRRSRSKNLGTNLAEVQRRLRYVERRPVRTKLQNKVVTTSAIAVNAVTQNEVSFGATVITTDNPSTIENPKEGLLVVSPVTGAANVYSEQSQDFIPIADPSAASIANGKNTIYYSASAPTGTFSVDDTWFDTDDGYKMYTWTGSQWSGFQLGNNAIASISAQKITAGTLAAGVILSSSISAGQITAGTISAAISIQGPTITGGTISLQTSNAGAGLFRTDTSGRRIEITDSDDIVFYGTSFRAGTITSIGSQWSGGGDDPYVINAGVMIYGGPSIISQGESTYPSIVATSDGTFMYGDSSTRFQAGNNLLGLYGPFGNLYNDVTHIYSGYSNTSNGTPWHTKMTGRLVWAENSEGPLSSGTGQPSSNGVLVGQVIFRYSA